MTKETYFYGYAPLAVIKDRYERDGETDWKLREALSKGVVFYNRRDVMDWAIQEKYKFLLRDICSSAAEYGQLHILKWLREEQGLKKDERFYYYAAEGGHLHVMKWLREQEVDLDKRTFYYAAEEGNLDILQWLHDEGCPWPDYNRVREDKVKPEVLEWLRTNGYRNRIVFRYEPNFLIRSVM